MDALAGLLPLLVALICGATIGAERTYHGRAAGLRTYALVCMGSALLLVLMNLPASWLASGMRTMYNVDPTRVVQGIMTGIGFLGAGVIVRERFSVRGLTTAASIWATATIGIVIGSGFIVPGLVATVLTLAILSSCKWLEGRIVAQNRVRCIIGFARECEHDEEWVRALFKQHRFTVTDMSYEQDEGGHVFHYDAVMWAHGKKSSRYLAKALRATPEVLSFSLAPTRE
ncbi:MAG: MgtC/SapB family protein [Burkholderiaceae bacterium]|jgi:putative Mg2+ transporter-C (MgtC) family protein